MKDENKPIITFWDKLFGRDSLISSNYWLSKELNTIRKIGLEKLEQYKPSFKDYNYAILCDPFDNMTYKLKPKLCIEKDKLKLKFINVGYRLVEIK